jgi:hypothetical protein
MEEGLQDRTSIEPQDSLVALQSDSEIIDLNLVGNEVCPEPPSWLMTSTPLATLSWE